MQNGTVLSNGKYSQYSDPNKKDNKIEISDLSIEVIKECNLLKKADFCLWLFPA